MLDTFQRYSVLLQKTSLIVHLNKIAKKKRLIQTFWQWLLNNPLGS